MYQSNQLNESNNLQYLYQFITAFAAGDLKGEFITLDYGNDPNGTPMPYVGESIDLAEVGLHPLRQFEGWRFTGWQGQPGSA